VGQGVRVLPVLDHEIMRRRGNRDQSIPGRGFYGSIIRIHRQRLLWRKYVELNQARKGQEESLKAISNRGRNGQQRIFSK
jgi:hypothetical protein